MPEPIVVIDVIVPPPPVIDVAAIGVQGPPGVPGEDGEPGPPGPQGEPGPPGEGAGPHQASHAAGGADQIVGPLALGVNPSQTGAVRLANNQSVTGRNADNTADMVLVRATQYNGVDVGGSGANYAGLTTNQGLTLGANDATQSGFTWAVVNTHALQPDTDNANDLGAPTYRVKAAHVGTSVNVGQNPAQTGAVRLANNQSVSARNATNDLDLPLLSLNTNSEIVIGDPANPTRQVFLEGLVGMRGRLDIYGQVLLRTETADPGAAPPNMAWLWLEDNGAGKSRIMARFASGAKVQIAIEP